MSKIAIVFPGQGAQYVGMGQALANQYPEAMTVFEEANTCLGFDLKKMCFEGPEEALKQTENTQPTILTTSIAAYEVLKAKGIRPAVVAGLSLGEYSALVAAGTLSFSDAVLLVKKRGRFMQDEVPDGVGGMAAILGLSDEAVELACDQASEAGIVQAANYNCPNQLVIAGEIKAVTLAVEKAKALGAKKAVMLPVSAPFHTRMLRGAGEKLGLEIDRCEIKAPVIPVVSNVDAAYYQGAHDVKRRLVDQVSHPVLWAKSVETMLADGVDVFIEVGPGNALSKFIKKISKDATIYRVEDVETLEATLAALSAT